MKFRLNINVFLLFIVAIFVSHSSAIAKEKRKQKIYDAVIVGGGVAGMTAAFYLKDYDIKVIEKRPSVGGRAFSMKHKEFTYACGAEYLGELTGPLKVISKKLKLKPREIPYPMDVYFDKGKFYYGEMGRALLAGKKSSLKEFVRFATTVQKIYQDYDDVPELDLKSKIAKLDNISAREWFKRNKFSDFYVQKYNVTFKGLFGANIDEISALSALTEIAFDYEGVDVKDEFSDIEDLENDSTLGKYKTGAFSFDKGIAEIPLAVAKHLGKKVLVNSTVVGLKKAGEHYLVTYRQNKNGKKYTIKTEAVILATPAPVTLAIGKKVLSGKQKKILKQVKYAPFVTVALYSPTPIFDRGFDLAVPDGMFFTDVYDATWIERFYNKGLKKKKTYITTVYVAPNSYKDKTILSMKDGAILNNIYKDLEKIFPKVRGVVTGTKVYRFKYAYPVMTIGAYKRLSALHNTTKKNLFFAGDYTIYPTLEAAADSGELAAEKVIEWLEDD